MESFMILYGTRGHVFAIKHDLRAKNGMTHLMYLDSIKLYAVLDDHPSIVLHMFTLP